MKKKRIEFKYGEFFCGPGGLALGAFSPKIKDKFGVEYSIVHEWANDYHKESCETYRNNLSSENPSSVICEDIKKLDLSILGKVDAFAYGFPCNDFSVVGKQKGFGGKFGPLYLHGINIINRDKPVFFVAENVGGIRSANDGGAFPKILQDLSEAGDGYLLTPHLYHAEDYGVPQTRHRVIIVGINKRLGLKFKVPKPTHLGRPVTVKEAFEKPPIPINAKNNEHTRQSPTVVERLSYIKPGQNVWTADLPKKLQLNVPGARLSQIYKRLDPNKPSYTLTGSGGGGTHGYHYSELRALTNRERARIQTFPDDFIFSGTNEAVRKQIGMAVPPKLATQIFSSILKTIAGVSYPSIDSNIHESLWKK